jgi:hypothetical protein
VDEDVVLTDLAYEKARTLGLELLRADDQPPAAPVRPYVAKLSSPAASASVQAQPSPRAGAPISTGGAGAKSDPDLFQRVYNASLARLGDSVIRSCWASSWREC